MDIDNEVVETKSTCFLCNKEGALAIFGILLGLVFIGMSIDIIRRTRIEQSEVTSVE